MAKKPSEPDARQFRVTRARKPKFFKTSIFVTAAIKAANTFMNLNRTSASDHTSDSECEAQDQKHDECNFRRGLKRKYECNTKGEVVLQFLKKTKSIANLKKHLPFIQKVLRDGMRTARLPPNSAVVADEFSVPECEAGEYYAEVFLSNVHNTTKGIHNVLYTIYAFQKSNHPEMFNYAITAFSKIIKDGKFFRRETLTRFSSKNALRINSHTVTDIITEKREMYTVRVPPGVTTIGHNAFFQCYRLQNVVLPESIEIIEENAFRWCVALQSISISSGITKIGPRAFDGNLSLQSIVVPASVTILGDDLFQLCMSLTNVSLPASLKSIPTGAFRYCVNLMHLLLPTSVTNIGSHSFANCVSLANLLLPEGVKTISEHAFQACVNLSELMLPYHKDGKVQIGKNAFLECQNLKVVYRPASSPVYVAWALGQSRNRNNWQLTTIMRLRNVLKLITYYGVERDVFEFDPTLLSHREERKEDRKLISRSMSWCF